MIVKIRGIIWKGNLMRKAVRRKREVAGKKQKGCPVKYPSGICFAFHGARKSEIGNIEISWFKFINGSSHRGYDKYRHSEQL
jgi:hypothetical protein